MYFVFYCFDAKEYIGEQTQERAVSRQDPMESFATDDMAFDLIAL
jgi:hypothetical protein